MPRGLLGLLLCIAGASCTNVVGGPVPPVARAGPDAVVNPGQTATLDGTRSHVPGDADATLSFRWEIASEPAPGSATLEGGSTAEPVLTPSAPGSYVVRLVVRHGRLDSRPAYVNVRAYNPNIAPIAVAGDDQAVDPAVTVRLDGSGSSDPDGDPIFFTWLQTGGAPVTLTSPDSATPSFTAPFSVEPLTFELTVTDRRGLTDRDATTVTINDSPPVARIRGPFVADEGGIVRLDGTTSSDPDDQAITAFRWTVSSTLGIVLSDPALSVVDFTVPSFCGSVPPVEVTLTVTAGGVNSVPALQSIALRDTLNDLPDAQAGDDLVTGEGVQVTLDGTSSSDCNGDSLTYTWTQTGGPPVLLADAATATPTFVSPGVVEDTDLVFELSVQDPRGGAAVDSVTVSVTNDVNEPPTANAGSDRTVVVRSSVQLLGIATDLNPADTSFTYQWNQVSGTSVTLSNPNAPNPTFTAPDNPTALAFTLVVNDGKDPSIPDTVNITVREGPPDLALSTIDAAAASLTADGAATTPVTVTVVDLAGNPLPGQPVAISTNRGTMIGSITNQGDGTYTQNLRTSTVAGTATVSFAVGGSTSPNTDTVAFLPGPPAGSFTLIATPSAIEADGVSTTTIQSGTISDANGNAVADGTRVTVSTTSGTLLVTDVDGTRPGDQIETASGAISFPLRSSNVQGTATVNALTVVGTGNGSVTVDFIPGLPSGTIAMTPVSGTLTADGSSTTQINCGPVRDSQGNTVAPGTLITVNIRPGAPGTILNGDVDGGTPGIQVATGPGGTFTLTVRAGTVAGTMTVEAASAQGSATGNTSITLVAGPPASTIVLTPTPASIFVVGTGATPTSTTVTSNTITDVNGNVVADGTFITVSVNLGMTISTLDADSGTPGHQIAVFGGQITFGVIAGSQAGSATVSASAASASGTGTITVQAGPPASMVFTTPSRTVTAAQCSAAVTVALEDVHGNPTVAVSAVTLNLSADSTMAFHLDAACGTSAVTSATIASGNGSGTFYFQDPLPGSPTITVAAAGLGNVTQGQTVVSAATVLAFTTPARTAVAGACSPIVTVEAQDGSGNAAAVGASTVVNLTADSGMTFYSNASCTTVITSVTLAAGTASASFYFEDTVVGTPTITADDGPGGLAQATQTQAIDPGTAVAIAFSTPPRSATVGGCSPVVTVGTEDAFGNPAPVAGNTALSLAADSAMTFYSNASCTTLVTSVTVLAATDSASFYFSDTAQGTPTITVSGLGTANQTQTVTSAAVKLAFSTPARTAAAGVCSQVVSVQAQDIASAPAAVGANTVVDLSATSGMTFYSDASCTTVVTSVTILSGNTSASFYFEDTLVGTPTITADDGPGGLAAGTQQQTIDPGAPTAIAFVTGPQTVVAGDCSGAVTVRTEDAFGNVAPVAGNTVLDLSANSGMIFYTGPACSAATVTSTITTGNSSTTFYFVDFAPGTPTITVDGTGASLGAITQQQQIDSAATALGFDTPARTAEAGTCSPVVTVESQDGVGSPAAVGSATPVNLSADSGMAFYSDAACTTVITSVTIAAGTSTASFYFDDAVAGTPTITAQATGLTGGTQQQTIDPGTPVAIVFLTTAQTVPAGSCSGIVTVGTEDALGNTAPVVSATPLDLTADSGMSFYSDAICNSLVTQVTISGGASSASFYFSDAATGTPTITVSDPAVVLTPANQQQTISGALTANAGADQSGLFPWDTVGLTGAASGGKPPYVYQWSVTSGPAGHTARFGSATTCSWPGNVSCNGAAMGFWPDRAGVYTVRLTVVDADFSLAFDDALISVNAFAAVAYDAKVDNANERESRRLAIIGGPGHVAIATANRGVIYMPDAVSKWADIDCTSGTSGSAVILAPDGAGNNRFYFGFDNSEVFTRVDGYTAGGNCVSSTSFNVRDSLSTNPVSVYDFALQSNGDLWIATDRDITVLVRGAAATTSDHAFATELNDAYGALRFTHEGELFVAHLTDGYHRTALPFNTAALHRDLDGSGNDLISYIARGGKAVGYNEMWVSTAGLGWWRLEDVTAPIPAWTQYDVFGSGIPSDVINQATFEDVSGDLWAATDGGVVRYKRDVDDVVGVVSGTSGLCTGQVLGVVADGFDLVTRGRRLWVGCASGLVRLDDTP